MMIHNSIKKIGIIAGQGDLPGLLVTACKKHNIDVFGVVFEGQENQDIINAADHICVKLGHAGKAISALKKQNITDIVMIGRIMRPSFSQLIPDAKTAAFLAKNAFKPLGDDGLLKALRCFLEDEGFTLWGIHTFMPELLTPPGALTKTKPGKQDEADIHFGANIIRALGALDIGQSAVIQDGLVLGVEAIEGTDALINRCAPLKREGRKNSQGVVVKMSKPGQDEDLDLPTCGLKTLENIHKSGYAGIALEAGKTLLVHRDDVIAFADQHKLFIVGI